MGNSNLPAVMRKLLEVVGRLLGLSMVALIAVFSFVVGTYVAARHATDLLGWLAVMGNIAGGMVAAVGVIGTFGMAMWGNRAPNRRSWKRTLVAWLGIAGIMLAASVLFLGDVVMEPNRAENWFFLGCAVAVVLSYVGELDKWARSARVHPSGNPPECGHVP